MLCSKYEKLMRQNGRSNKESDSALNVINGGKTTFMKQFKTNVIIAERLDTKELIGGNWIKVINKRPNNWSSNSRNYNKNDLRSNSQIKSNGNSFNGFCYVCGKRGHCSSECPMKKTKAVSKDTFLNSKNEGVVLLSCCSRFDYTENGSNESEAVEFILGDTSVHSNVNKLTKIVRKMDSKLSILDDKIDRVNDWVDLVDEKCNMILEDDDESNLIIKTMTADIKNVLMRKT